MIIGLTGGSGTGKTYISQFFKAEGYTVIDYDELTKTVYKKGSACLGELEAAFGADIIDACGELNRRRLGDIVFNDKKSLELLNKIVYKYLIRYSDELIKKADGNVLLDAPTLFEAGLDGRCDKIIAVTAKKNLRIARIMRRDGISKQQALSRINSQKDDEFYKKHCDYIIDNSYGEADLKGKIVQLIGELGE